MVPLDFDASEVDSFTHPAQSPPGRDYVYFPDGDVVLRSKDGVDFRVDAVVLERASKFFETLFQLPNPSPSRIQTDSATTEPLVLDETSAVLDMLLRIIYSFHPHTSKNVSSPSDLHSLLRAVDKFEITAAAVGTLVDELIAQHDPLQSWALAVTYHRPAARKLAVIRLIHDRRGRDVFLQDFPELDSISVRAYSRLLRVHDSASRGLMEVLGQLDSRHSVSSGCLHEEQFSWKHIEGMRRLSRQLGDPESYTDSVDVRRSWNPADYSDSELLAIQNCATCVVHFAKRDAIEQRNKLRAEADELIQKYATEEATA